MGVRGALVLLGTALVVAIVAAQQIAFEDGTEQVVELNAAGGQQDVEESAGPAVARPVDCRKFNHNGGSLQFCE